MPVGVGTFSEAMAVSSEVNLVLHDLLATRYGKAAVNVGTRGDSRPLSASRQRLWNNFISQWRRLGFRPRCLRS